MFWGHFKRLSNVFGQMSRWYVELFLNMSFGRFNMSSTETMKKYAQLGWTDYCAVGPEPGKGLKSRVDLEKWLSAGPRRVIL